MQDLFSQKAFVKLREVSRVSYTENGSADGINIIWLNPEFSGQHRCKQNLKLHSHTFYEVHFVLEGRITYRTKDGKLFDVNENEFLFIPPAAVHAIESKSDEYKKFGLAFSYSPDEFNQYIFKEEIYKGTDCRWIGDIFSTLAIGLEMNNGTEPQMFQNITSLLVSFVTSETKIVTEKAVKSVPDERFIRAKRFIEDNSTRDISVDEVASFVYLSPKHLGRIFRENGQTSVSDFIAKSRCDRVKKMLESKEITISDIVERLNFSNEQNFNRFFKRIEGVTPGNYRELKGRLAEEK